MSSLPFDVVKTTKEYHYVKTFRENVYKCKLEWRVSTGLGEHIPKVLVCMFIGTYIYKCT